QRPSIVMVTRRLNVRFALVLAGSLAVLSTGAYFLHARNVRASAGVLLERAERARQDKELTKAADYFGRYLSFKPADADALASYGLLLAEPELNRSRRDTLRAINTLERASLRNPDRADLRRRLVDLQISAGFLGPARDNIVALKTKYPG